MGRNGAEDDIRFRLRQSHRVNGTATTANGTGMLRNTLAAGSTPRTVSLFGNSRSMKRGVRPILIELVGLSRRPQTAAITETTSVEVCGGWRGVRGGKGRRPTVSICRGSINSRHIPFLSM